MTISSETNKVIYTGNGVTTVFPYTFKILDDDEILVQTRLTTTGVYTTLVKTTDYTVSGVGTAAGGNITLVSAASNPTGTKLILTRSMPQTQTVDLAEFDAFPADTVEDQLDRAVMIAQEQQEQLDRSIKWDASISGVSATILGTPTALYSLRVNSGATGLEFAAFASTGSYAFGSGVGILAQTASLTASVVTLTGTANEITVTNGTGVGTPTFSLPTALTFTGKTVTGGTFASPVFSGTVTGTYTLAGTPTITTITGASGFVTILGTSANASGIKLSEDTDNGTNTVSIQAPASIASDKVITLPDLTGTVVLSTTVGSVVQVKSVTNATTTSQTAIIPADTSKPQNTEGTELVTLAITPTNANNILVIEAAFPFACSTLLYGVLALFQDTTADAIAVSIQVCTATDLLNTCVLKYRMVAGTTSATTFKLRFGPGSAGTIYPNGNTSFNFAGLLQTTFTITEIVA